DLPFDDAFQKSVRINFPGIYHIIVATEYLYKIPFHEALGFYLNTVSVGAQRLQIDHEQVFALAEVLAQYVRSLAHHLALEREAHRRNLLPAPPAPTPSTPPGKPKQIARPIPHPPANRPKTPV